MREVTPTQTRLLVPKCSTPGCRRKPVDGGLCRRHLDEMYLRRVAHLEKLAARNLAATNRITEQIARLVKRLEECL